MTFSIVVPTLNPGQLWTAWIAAVKQQTCQPRSVLVIDSSSDDDTLLLSRAAGFEVCVIARADFNHGATRQLAVERLIHDDFLVFLTQDAILANAFALEKIVECFADPDTGVVYGRQLPRLQAGHIESHARLFNYPATSRQSKFADCKQLGIRAVFNSNSFAAYRPEALMSVGGFPAHAIVSEDVYVAVKMLQHNWNVVYCADAQVYHSHDYTMMQEFCRYFDIGVFHAREHWMAELLGRHEGEGLKFLKSEWRYLFKMAPYLIPVSLLRTIFKYLGYRLGKLEGFLPVFVKRRCSMQKSYWV